MSRAVSDPDSHLWLAVIAQALEDLEYEAWHSTLQAQAVAFFLHAGPWGQRRNEIAEHLGLSGDDIRRVGVERLAQREARDPAPLRELPPPCAPTPAAAAPRAPATPLKLPHLVAIPAPEPALRPRNRGGWPSKRWHDNPFDPFRNLPSEERAQQRALSRSATA